MFNTHKVIKNIIGKDISRNNKIEWEEIDVWHGADDPDIGDIIKLTTQYKTVEGELIGIDKNGDSLIKKNNGVVEKVHSMEVEWIYRKKKK